MELKLYTKAFFLSFLFLFSCTKNETPLDDPNVPVIGNLPELGTLSFKYNGVEYEADKVSAGLDQFGSFWLSIHKSFYPQKPVDETFYFSDLPLKKANIHLDLAMRMHLIALLAF